jgi:hypothetical protein
MKAIGEIIQEKNLQLDTVNPVLQGGFTQVPNFILKNSKISVGAKVAYAMFLSLWRSLKFTHLCSDKLTHLVHSTAQCFFFPRSDFAFLVGQAAGVADGPAMLRL